MKELKLLDKNFPHTEFTTQYQTSDKIKWNRNFDKVNDDEILIATDDCIMYNDYTCRMVGMLMEPRAINPRIYNFLSKEENTHKFERILTYDKELLDLSDKFEFYPHCGCWIQPEFQQIHQKDKLVSIIASSKRMTLGHKLRHQVIERFNQIDAFGIEYKYLDHKIEALEKYRFSVVIENCKIDYYFTEKLIDAFITGTIPIYWGCPSIGDFFNLDGMLIIESLEDLDRIMDKLSPKLYENMLNAAKENFELAKRYLIAEEWLYATDNRILK